MMFDTVVTVFDTVVTVFDTVVTVYDTVVGCGTMLETYGVVPVAEDQMSGCIPLVAEDYLRFNAFDTRDPFGIDELLTIFVINSSIIQRLGDTVRFRRWRALPLQFTIPLTSPAVNVLCGVAASFQPSIPFSLIAWVDKICKYLDLDLDLVGTGGSGTGTGPTGSGSKSKNLGSGRTGSGSKS
ncbi:hypothetical protein LXL04_001555 [Taraxacum kok-saghyz]